MQILIRRGTKRIMLSDLYIRKRISLGKWLVLYSYVIFCATLLYNSLLVLYNYTHFPHHFLKTCIWNKRIQFIFPLNNIKWHECSRKGIETFQNLLVDILKLCIYH